MLINYPEQSSAPFSDSFGCSLLDAAERFNDRPALWVDDCEYLYSELVQQGLAIAATLQALKFASGRCAILAYRSAVAYQGICGTLLAGGCYVPLNPRFPVDKNQSVLASATSDFMIVDRRSEETARQLLLKHDSVMSVLLPEHQTLPEWCQETPHRFICQPQLLSADNWKQPELVNRHAYMLFTSGTTGKPKGIAVSHQNMKAYVSNILEKYTLTSRDRFSQMSDLTFDLSVHDIGCAWTVGGCLYITPEAALLCPADFVNRHQLSCWNSVPSLLGFMNKFGKMKPGSFPHLRYSFFCGEAMPTAMADKWRKATPGGTVVNLYGPTEATVAITSLDFTMECSEQANLPIGQPLSHQEVMIVDDKGQQVEAGEQGELWLGGSQVTDGYWCDEERTQQAFIKKTFPDAASEYWYKTGDLVSRHEHYGLVFHGRKDFQVKINGFRVELGEIEAVVRNQFECDWVAAIPWPVDRAGAAKGVVVWLPGIEGDAQGIRQHCAKKLPPYMVPGNVFWTEELPRNANGKVDIKALQTLTQEKIRFRNK